MCHVSSIDEDGETGRVCLVTEPGGLCRYMWMGLGGKERSHTFCIEHRSW